MQLMNSIRWLAVEEKLGGQNSVALFLAVGVMGVALASGTASVAVTARSLRLAVAPGAPEAPRAYSSVELARWSTARFLTVAHRDGMASASSRSAPARRSRPAVVPVPVEDLDLNAPVAEAVRARGLLAALLSMEAEGDTTQTSEGLESIASTAAIAVALSGAGPDALLAETAELPRKDSERLFAAPGVDAAPVEIREVSLQIPETPARNSLNPAGSSFSS